MRARRLRVGSYAIAWLFAFALITLMQTSALAQHAGTNDAASTPQSDADALIRHGVELRRRGNDEAALAEFRRAHEIAPTPRALVQIAMAEQALGHWLDASAHLREGLLAASDPWILANSAALQAPLEVIDRHLGSLEVRASIDGAELWVNDRRAGSLPLTTPLRLVTGTAVIELRLAGYQTMRRSIEIDPGGLARESFTLVAVRAPDAIPLPHRRVIDLPSRVVVPAGSLAGPVALLGVSAVSFGAAGLFWALRANSIRNCEVDPTNSERLICATAADVREAAQGRTYTALTNVALITGAVAAVASAVWLVVRNARQPAAPESHASAWFVPVPGGMVFGVEGHL